jgi:hypothetical protein
MQKFKAVLLLVLLFNLAFAQEVIVARRRVVSSGVTPNYGGQTCQGGQNTTPTATSQACSASITVSTGDIIGVCGTLGDNIALTSITHSGTASITWNVVSGMRIFDSTNGQEIVGGWGNVTSGGTATPSINFTGGVNGFDAIFAANFTGAQATTDGQNSIQNTGSTATNGNKSGQITTTVNGDLLIGCIVDTAGAATTINAGTVSATMTKIGTCNDQSSARLCMEWGVQTTAGSGTEADWTLVTNADRTVGNILGVKHQ